MKVISQKKLVKDVSLTIHLRPKKELSLSSSGKLWKKLLDYGFRSSMGKIDIDHIASSGPGESHVEYKMGSIDVLMYDTGRIDIDDDKFIPARSRQLDKILTVILSAIGGTAKKRLDVEVSALIHLILVGPSLSRFLGQNIAVRTTPKFRKAFRKYIGFKSTLLQISSTLDVVFQGPSHLDFLYHDVVSTAANRKPFVDQFTRTTMQYIESISRLA